MLKIHVSTHLFSPVPEVSGHTVMNRIAGVLSEKKDNRYSDLIIDMRTKIGVTLL